jgi:1,4-dihydroxy-2-naphthoyl-CoA hydrolase
MRLVIETDAVNEGIHAALDIELVSADPNEVIFEMPIGPKVHQPWGILHGGASAVLAESAASVGAYLNCDRDTQYAVGVDLNICHLRARSSGRLRARATPVRKGRSIHVWSVDLSDEAGDRVAVALCTLAIRNLDSGPG